MAITTTTERSAIPPFRHPGAWPGEIYPHHAGPLIEGLRRFIGADLLARTTQLYRSPERSRNGVRIARLRERQPLIESFEVYSKASFGGRRPLARLEGELLDLTHIAAHCQVIAPTLSGSIEDHHRQKLINLDGQLKPLLLEWVTASHFARANRADIAWLPVDQTGPEFIARAQGVEWEVECKRQSQMIVALLGETEADRLAELILGRVAQLHLQGDLTLHVPLDFDARSLNDQDVWPAALDVITGPGNIEYQLPGGLRLETQLRRANGLAIESGQWISELRARHMEDARSYAQAGASAGNAIDPLHLQMIGARRAGLELIDYLWDRKFSRAAGQCSGERGAVLVFEWEGLSDPEIFREPVFQALMARTFDEHRHVAAISMRCDATPTHRNGVIDYSTGAFLALSDRTSFPEVAALVRLDEAR